MDNIINSLLTIFVLSSLEGWNDITYTFIDSNSADVGPVYDNRMIMLLYSIIIIYMCSFFLQNLFIGIIFLNYNIAELNTHSERVTPQLKDYITIQKSICEAESLYRIYMPP